MVAFDDVEAGDVAKPYSSVGEAQAAVANRCCIAMYDAMFATNSLEPRVGPSGQRQEVAPMFLFCPTEYCGRIAQPGTVGSAYLSSLGRELLPIIDVCWTGEEIISPTITMDDVVAVSESVGVGHHAEAAGVQRRILLWDNYHANDYDQGRRIYLGPYADRETSLLSSPLLAGILSNPNVQYECNYIPLATLGLFVANATAGGRGYDPELAAEVAVASWTGRFGDPVTQEDVRALPNATFVVSARKPFDFTCVWHSVDQVALLVDLCYLPYKHGTRGTDLIQQLDELHLLADTYTLDPAPARGAAIRALTSKFHRRAGAVAGLFARLTEIRQRELCYAIYPYLWDLKEEMDVLSRYVGWLCRTSTDDEDTSGDKQDLYEDDEQPETIYPKFELIYRGGMLAELQRRVPLARDVQEAYRLPGGTVSHFRRLPAPRL